MTRLVAVVPVGPVPEAFVEDTLASIGRHCPQRRLIVVDDSRSDVGARLAQRHGAELVPAGEGGQYSGLYRNLSAGFRRALSEPFDVLLRIDTDARVLGGRFPDLADDLFRRRPRVGLLGNYRLTFHGTPRSFAPPATQLRRVVVREAWRRPRRSAYVAALVARAMRHGYRLGEHVLGGVCLYSEPAVRALERHGLLGVPRLGDSGLGEDHIFSLCLRSLGFELAQFGGHDDDLPVAAQWIGLPAAPAELVRLGKELVHSTKEYDGLGEAEIRRQFVELGV